MGRRFARHQRSRLLAAGQPMSALLAACGHRGLLLRKPGSMTKRNLRGSRRQVISAEDGRRCRGLGAVERVVAKTAFNPGGAACWRRRGRSSGGLHSGGALIAEHRTRRTV